MATVVLLFVLLGALVTVLLHLGQHTSLSIFTPEHVRMLSMVDNAPERLAHRVALILLAVLTLSGIVVLAGGPGPRGFRMGGAVGQVAGLIRKSAGVLVVVAAASVFLLQLQGMVFNGFQGRRLRLTFWLISACLTMCGSIAARRLSTRAFNIVASMCLVAYLLYLIVPGFTQRPLLSEPFLSSVEWHYSVTLAQGDRLAAGLSLGKEINLNYGLIPNLMLAVAERVFGLLDFGEHVRLVQASQVAFLITAIAAFYLWRPRNALFVLFAATLVGPWLSTSHLSIYFPNQAGWRGFGFAAGVLLLLSMRRQSPRRAALILGAGAGLLILYNPETGLCLAFGYGLFLLSRLRRLKAGIIGALAVNALSGAAVVFASVIIFYRAGLGIWPPLRVGTFLGLITRFGGGYGSLPLHFDPLALLIFIHSAYIVIVNTIRWSRRELSFDDSVRLALAGMILTWFTYYTNRPHPWNLWTYQFLYVFLLADWLAPRLLQHLRRSGWKAALDPRLAALTLIIVPSLLYMNQYILTSTLNSWREPSIDNLTTLSGTSMPVSLADDLRVKAEFLSRQDASSTLYLTRHSYSMPLLTGRFIPLPFQDAFAETITVEDFERLVGGIHERRPQVILFDAPETSATGQEAAFEWYNRFYARLKDRISEWYEPRRVTNGWEVWESRN